MKAKILKSLKPSSRSFKLWAKSLNSSISSPDFQNPAGVTMSEKRRKEILELAYKYDVMIIEDSPYRELRYEGETQKTMYEMDGTGHVIMLGTFSKDLLPRLSA